MVSELTGSEQWAGCSGVSSVDQDSSSVRYCVSVEAVCVFTNTVYSSSFSS